MSLKIKQQGIALISALLIVALATVITVSITSDQSFAVQRSGFLLQRAQGLQLMLGLEDWAETFLIKDSKKSKTDDLSENWATKIPILPIENGYLSGYIEDEQAKINLNSLLNSAQTLRRFTLLCQQLEVETDFIPALLDWLDEDVDVRYPDGAEDDYYSGLTPLAYRTGNHLMGDVSELLLVKNMDYKDYQRLLPFITVLPEATSLNVNTLSQEVFLALDKSLNDTHYERYFEERENAPYDSVKSMLEQLEINIEEEGLDVKTAYFSLHGTVVQNDQQLSATTVIKRENKTTQTVSRQIGN